MSLANVNVRPIRPQQHRLKWPLTPEQVEGIDEMLETLFKATRELQQGVRTVSEATGSVAAVAALALTQPNDVDDGMQMIAPGPPGPQGPIGPVNGALVSLPPDAADEPPFILVPGPAGPQGPAGVSLFGMFEDSGSEATEILIPPGTPVETGSWTPIDSSGASLVFAFAAGSFIKIGPLIYATFQVVYPATASAAVALIGGLPYKVGAVNAAFALGYANGGPASLGGYASNGSTTFQPDILGTGANATNVQLTGANIIFSGIYSIL